MRLANVAVRTGLDRSYVRLPGELVEPLREARIGISLIDRESIIRPMVSQFKRGQKLHQRLLDERRVSVGADTQTPASDGRWYKRSVGECVICTHKKRPGKMPGLFCEIA